MKSGIFKAGIGYLMIAGLLCTLSTCAGGSNLTLASDPDGIFVPDLVFNTGPLGINPGGIVGGVRIFPPDHIWNVRVDNLPVDPNSDLYVNTIGRTASLHPDFGAGLWNGHMIGIPFNVVTSSTPKVRVRFDYADESDKVRYPIPAKPKIEGGSDHHMLIIQKDEKKLYELYDVRKDARGWRAGSGAVWNLSRYTLRPAGWTSADAAGLAILPGLVRYNEVASGEIRHAIRFTAPQTRNKYIWPARHQASSLAGLKYPPMGQRFRLKASFDVSGYPPHDRVILTALKRYGMILADNGAPWYISGAPNGNWDNDVLHLLHQVHGDDFEAVDCSSLMINVNSGRAAT